MKSIFNIYMILLTGCTLFDSCIYPNFVEEAIVMILGKDMDLELKIINLLWTLFCSMPPVIKEK